MTHILRFCTVMRWLSHFGSNFNTSRCHFKSGNGYPQASSNCHKLCYFNKETCRSSQWTQKWFTHSEELIFNCNNRTCTFYSLQKQCIKEKRFPHRCGLFCCVCLWRRLFHTKKQGSEDIQGQFFLHKTQRRQIEFSKLKYLPHIYAI